MDNFKTDKDLWEIYHLIPPLIISIEMESMGRLNLVLFQVPLVQNQNKSGLGFANTEFIQCEVDSCTEKKQALWRKTQQRYNGISN